MENLKNWGMFIILSVVWGASFLLIKIAGEDLAPFTLVSVRLGLATVGLWAASLIAGIRPPSDLRTLGQLTFLGIINTGIPFTLVTWGEQTIASGVASILNSGTPLFTLILAHIFLADERITLQRLGGLLLGFGGVMLIFSRSLDGLFIGGGVDSAQMWGQAAVLLAAACYAVGAVYTRRALDAVHPFMLATIPITASFFFTVGGAVVFEAPIDLTMRPISLISLVILGLLGVSMAHIMFFTLIKEWGATRTTLVTYLIPVVGLTLGVLILDETLDWRLIVGFILVIGGIVLVNRKKRRQPKDAQLTKKAAK